MSFQALQHPATAGCLQQSASMATYTEMGASIAARAFFYPSLLFNIARERLQEDWHWCDLVTEVS